MSTNDVVRVIHTPTRFTLIPLTLAFIMHVWLFLVTCLAATQAFTPVFEPLSGDTEPCIRACRGDTTCAVNECGEYSCPCSGNGRYDVNERNCLCTAGFTGPNCTLVLEEIHGCSAAVPMTLPEYAYVDYMCRLSELGCDEASHLLSRNDTIGLEMYPPVFGQCRPRFWGPVFLTDGSDFFGKAYGTRRDFVLTSMTSAFSVTFREVRHQPGVYTIHSSQAPTRTLQLLPGHTVQLSAFDRGNPTWWRVSTTSHWHHRIQPLEDDSLYLNIVSDYGLVVSTSNTILTSVPDTAIFNETDLVAVDTTGYYEQFTTPTVEECYGRAIEIGAAGVMVETAGGVSCTIGDTIIDTTADPELHSARIYPSSNWRYVTDRDEMYVQLGFQPCNAGLVCLDDGVTAGVFHMRFISSVGTEVELISLDETKRLVVNPITSIAELVSVHDSRQPIQSFFIEYEGDYQRINFVYPETDSQLVFVSLDASMTLVERGTPAAIGTFNLTRPCSSSPCMNGATCSNVDGAWQCTCAAGYTGDVCDTELNECDSNPCVNGGVCYDGIASFSCVCNYGTFGPQCQFFNHCDPYYLRVDPGYYSTTTQTAYNNLTATYSLSFWFQGETQQVFRLVDHPGTGGISVNWTASNQLLLTRLPNQDAPSLLTFSRGDWHHAAITMRSSGVWSMWVDAQLNVDEFDFGDGYALQGIDHMDAFANIDDIFVFHDAEITSQMALSMYMNSDLYPDMSHWLFWYPFTGYEMASQPLTYFAGQGSFSTSEAMDVASCGACNPMPCQNGGVCSNTGPTTFSCSCPDGFTGTACETEINECASTPCLNEGTCNDQVNGYECTCTDAYTGFQCETYQGCASSPCQNGASCIDGASTYTCTCDTGYSGVVCQTDINECASLPCSNGGTCMDDVAGYSCVCVDGFSGSDCQTDIDECSSNPCMNGGTCTQL
jgi:hypothetical protein